MIFHIHVTSREPNILRATLTFSNPENLILCMVLLLLILQVQLRSHQNLLLFYCYQICNIIHLGDDLIVELWFFFYNNLTHFQPGCYYYVLGFLQLLALSLVYWFFPSVLLWWLRLSKIQWEVSRHICQCSWTVTAVLLVGYYLVHF